MAEVPCYHGSINVRDSGPCIQGSLNSPSRDHAWARPPQVPTSSQEKTGKPAWSAGPGGGGYAPGCGQPSLVCTGGVRHKKLQVYAGAGRDHEARNAAADRLLCSQEQARDAARCYQKDAARRAAEGAIRPWSAYAGLGERKGGQFGSLSAQAASYGSLEAPSRFYPPDGSWARAVSARAGKVRRPGSGQVDTPGAWSPVPGQPKRELWAQDLKDPTPHCAPCRGVHDPSKECSGWEPYTPHMRLTNLNVLVSRFQDALLKGQLCVALNDGSRVQPVKWTWKAADQHGDQYELTPNTMCKDDFVRQLSLMFDGLREGHEPYRHLATQACIAFFETGSKHLAAAAPACVIPLRLALQTYEPSLVGHALLMLQKYIRSHPKVCPALAPHLKQLLPPVALMFRKNFTVHLPPPFCVGAAGSFTGSGIAPEAGSRTCTVCGCLLDKQGDSEKARAKAASAAADNPHLLGEDLPQTYSRHALQGRWNKKYVLRELIRDTLDLVVSSGGKPALDAIVKVIPTYQYYNPKD